MPCPEESNRNSPADDVDLGVLFETHDVTDRQMQAEKCVDAVLGRLLDRHYARLCVYIEARLGRLEDSLATMQPVAPNTQPQPKPQPKPKLTKQPSTIKWASQKRALQKLPTQGTLGLSPSTSRVMARGLSGSSTASEAQGQSTALEAQAPHSEPPHSVERGEAPRSVANVNATRLYAEDLCEEAMRKVSRADDPEEVELVQMELAERIAQARSMIEEGGEKANKRWLDTIVDSSYFEMFFALAIVSNAVIIGVQADLEAKGEVSQSDLSFRVISIIYTAMFTVELGFKLCRDRWAFFFTSTDWHWNWLDTLIVCASLVDVAVEESMVLEDTSTSSTSQIRILRMIRITRLIRIVRVGRIIRFIRALRTLVHQIMSTLKSLAWALLLLMLLIYLFAIFFTQTVSSFLLNGDDSIGVAPESKLLLQTYWSTVPRSMLTLFKAITDGISWDIVVTPLLEIGALPLFMLLIYIAFTELAVLNVLTGAFCQAAIDSANHDQELVAQQILSDKSRYIKQISNMFLAMDSNSTGMVTIKEFQDHLEDENIRAYFEALGLDTSDIWNLFRLMDQDHGACLDMDEFITGCLRLRGNARGIDLAKLNYEHTWFTKRIGKHMRLIEETLERLEQVHAASHAWGCTESKQSQETLERLEQDHAAAHAWGCTESKDRESALQSHRLGQADFVDQTATATLTASL